MSVQGGTDVHEYVGGCWGACGVCIRLCVCVYAQGPRAVRTEEPLCPALACLPLLGQAWLPQRGHVFLEGSYPSRRSVLMKVEKSSQLPTLPLVNRELLSGSQGGAAPCFS